MLEEADDNSDRRLDFQEFKVLAFDLSTGALKIQAPAFSEEEAPPEFLSRQVFLGSVSVCASSAICLSQARTHSIYVERTHSVSVTRR